MQRNLEELLKTTIYNLIHKYPKAIREDIEDAVQSSLLRYLELYGSLDDITPQWLKLATYRKWLDIMKRNRRAIPSELMEELEMPCQQQLTDISLDTRHYKEVKNAADNLRLPDDLD